MEEMWRKEDVREKWTDNREEEKSERAKNILQEENRKKEGCNKRNEQKMKERTEEINDKQRFIKQEEEIKRNNIRKINIKREKRKK